MHIMFSTQPPKNINAKISTLRQKQPQKSLQKRKNFKYYKQSKRIPPGNIVQKKKNQNIHNSAPLSASLPAPQAIQWLKTNQKQLKKKQKRSKDLAHLLVLTVSTGLCVWSRFVAEAGWADLQDFPFVQAIQIFQIREEEEERERAEGGRKRECPNVCDPGPTLGASQPLHHTCFP